MSTSGERKKTANSLEKDLARELGGRRVPASGAIAHLPGDIYTDEFLIDSKNTEKNTIPLKVVDLAKIHREARDGDKLGHLILTFIEHDIHWAVVPEKYTKIEGYVFELLAKKQKGISRSYLASCKNKARKKGKYPVIRVFFETVPLGVPRTWLIIPLEQYKELL